MRSRAAFLDVSEGACWIATQLQKEGLAIPDDLVLRILNWETRFLVMVGLARAGDQDGAEAGHILREACWVLHPKARTGADCEVEPEERGCSESEI